MADEGKIGTDWQADELDLIIADYFDMLGDEAAGRPYVKAHHNKSLRTEIGRSHAAVEFKHGNISAVLDGLGYPTIGGYKPRPHFQDALLRAVERYLDHRPELASTGDLAPRSWEPELAEAATMFENLPPQPSDAIWARDPGMLRLVRKFDPSIRDARNRALGKTGEKLAFQCEQNRLRAAGRPDLARRVRWVPGANDNPAPSAYVLTICNIFSMFSLALTPSPSREEAPTPCPTPPPTFPPAMPTAVSGRAIRADAPGRAIALRTGR